MLIIASSRGIAETNTLNRSDRGVIGRVIVEIFATLVGQNLSHQLFRSNSNRVLLVTWLVFAFIVGTVYRGNLTAALTVPNSPPRPETVEQLVNYAKR